ncbi:MAG: Gfo/Idh/MocA family oxidoreductase [Nitrospirota bacterium]
MIGVGVVGYGYWGPNLVRNFHALENAKVVKVCDRNPAALKRLAKTYPGIEGVTSADEIMKSTEIDAVVIATPVSAHFELAKEALQHGKHIFVEKPFTVTSAQSERLIELAEKKNLKIMVDHTFLFTGSVRKMKQLIDDGVLGQLYYYDSTRVNLGLFQHDVNVIWDLAPHDLSIMDFLLKDKPVAVTANGRAHFGNGLQDIAYITVYFANDMLAHFNVNWLSPVKVRTTLIGGEKKMLAWNDLEADEKIRIYDKGIEVKSGEGIYNLLVSYRSGDMWVPRLEQTEALKTETEYFVHCVSNNETPFNDGRAGLRVVRMLEACTESLAKDGGMVTL